jgi:hypothetical protein
MTAVAGTPPDRQAMHSSRLSIASRFSRASGFAYGLLAVFLLAGSSPASTTTPPLAPGAPPDSLTDAEFWSFFTGMSEAGGHFLSENFVSNEVSFQEVIPTLQKTLTPNGVYLGVGPEQNFTYIANLAPKMAVIFDIRRQNAMQHLMYKALFEMSPRRVDFVAKLFSRPSVEKLPAGIAVQAMFDSASRAAPSDSAYQANFADIIDLLTVKKGFGLSKDDIATIEHVYKVFFTAGPAVNYGYRMGMPVYRTAYPDYGLLQSATNADSVQTAFLATEPNYNAIRVMQLRNLIVPVVGDFGGPSAIRSVGKWLSERQMTVTAFYVSNVEQYLFRDLPANDRFYANVSALPIDTTSRFIRSVPRSGGMPMVTFSQSTFPAAGSYTSISITRDAQGNTVTQTIRDSAGVRLVQTTVDSAAVTAPGSFRLRRDSTQTRTDTMRIPTMTRDSLRYDTTAVAQLRNLIARRDSIVRLNSTWQIAGPTPGTQVFMGGLLTSGIASVTKTLESFFAGQLKRYDDVINMTRTTGWR